MLFSPHGKDKRGNGMNLLAYVHLRNIHGSTGAGRVARQLVEHLAPRPGLEMRILADPGDHRRIVPLVGEPWSSYRYHFIARETSKQQAQWFFLHSPAAEHYWPQADVVFCTAESYVPTRKARLAVTLHDAAFFEQGAHVGWRSVLETEAEVEAPVSHAIAEGRSVSYGFGIFGRPAGAFLSFYPLASPRGTQCGAAALF